MNIALLRDIKPLVFWEGFPACGLLLSQVVKQFPDVKIVATRATVPFKDLESLLGTQIHWLEDPNDILVCAQDYSDRNFIIHTGWNHYGWLRYDKFIRKKNNAKIVAVVDNRFKANLRQALGALYFRLCLRQYFDAVFVPGREGQKLLSFLGMPGNRIYVGNYGAYEGVYSDRVPILMRKNEFLFVGQLSHRKGLDVLLNAFRHYRAQGGTWDLRILGDGPMRNYCSGNGIILEGFTQPHLVAEAMNRSKVLVLVSRDDHWGTVVCEAAACGSHLITTRYVGASTDIVRNGINGIELSNLSEVELSAAFNYYEQLDDDLMENGSEVSKGIAKGYDSAAYYTAFRRMAYELFQ